MIKRKLPFPGGIEFLIAALACLIAREQSEIPEAYSLLMISAIVATGLYYLLKGRISFTTRK